MSQKWFIDGQKVWYNFYLAATGFSHHYVYKHKKLLANNHGVTAASIDNFVSVLRKNNSSTNKDDFIAWLTEYASSVGDYMPDKESIVLPYPKFEGVGKIQTPRK
jgi:hypothetical protein